MSDLDILGLFAGGDAGSAVHTTAAVYAVDPAGRRVQVAVQGSAMWLPAVAGRYRVAVAASSTDAAGSARVLLHPATGRPVLVLGPVNPRDPTVPGSLTAVDTGTHRATVSLDGASHSLPYLASTYTVGTPVWVGLDDWGRPFIVQGSSDDTPVAPTPPTPPAGGGTIQVVQPIGPQWSGSWRATRGAWDRWNTSTYGGRSTLYQGDGFGSGPMTGLATYGDQLLNLGAISIDRIRVMLRGVGLSGASGPATVQGSPNGSQPAGAPSASGDTATGDGWVELTAGMRGAFATGAVKGLALVGANYWAVAGAGNGDGMQLEVTYTRPA